MRIAIVGSRNAGEAIAVRWSIDEFLGTLPRDTVIVSGGARGVDQHAAQLAGNLGLSVVVHFPDWDKHGRGAGFVRNAKIVEDADEIHAWWDGQSRGTAHTLDLARKAGKPVTVHRIDHANLGAPPGAGTPG